MTSRLVVALEWEWAGRTTKEHKETLGVMNMFTILIVWWLW